MGLDYQHQEDQNAGHGQGCCCSDALVVIRGEQLEAVSQFNCLGSMATSDSMLDMEIAHGLASANSAFARLHQAKV